MKGLPVYIYKNEGRDFSNGGISSQHEEALLVGEGIPEIFEANGRPMVELREGYARGTVFAAPYGDGDKRPMNGGCFIATSDSRFRDAVEKLLPKGTPFYGAIPLHDRYEG